MAVSLRQEQHVPPATSEEPFKLTPSEQNQLVEFIDEAVLVRDAAGVIRYWSKGAERLYGWQPEEALGRETQVLLRTEGGEPGASKGLHSSRLGQWTGRLRQRRKDGSVVEVDSRWLTRWADGRPAGFVVINRPLPARHRVAEPAIDLLSFGRRRRSEADRERLLRAAQEAQEVAERALALRDEFVSVAAHELKTPVASLKLCAQLMERRMSSGPVSTADMLRGLQTVGEQSDRLARLIEGLLDIARLHAGKFELSLGRTEVVGLTRSVIKLLEPVLRGLALSLTAPAQLWAQVDALRLEQILTNLLTNAAKFTLGPKPIEVTLAAEAAHLVVAVRDFGLGIPVEARDDLFARFHQAHSGKHQGGLGLGLYISREIAQAHSGTLIAEHPADGGARFVLRLPLAPPAAGQGV